MGETERAGLRARRLARGDRMQRARHTEDCITRLYHESLSFRTALRGDAGLLRLSPRIDI